MLEGKPERAAMRCEVADEPVVVQKLRPLKPGNGVEGKTGVTRWHPSIGGTRRPKAACFAKG